MVFTRVCLDNGQSNFFLPDYPRSWRYYNQVRVLSWKSQASPRIGRLVRRHHGLDPLDGLTVIKFYLFFIYVESCTVVQQHTCIKLQR